MRTQAELERTLAGLVDAALSSDVPLEVAFAARDATKRALGVASPGEERTLPRRAKAYFGSVVRRQAVRRKSCRRASARLVLASVVEDLEREGRGKDEIWDELERGWVDMVPRDVLEEFRPLPSASRAA